MLQMLSTCWINVALDIWLIFQYHEMTIIILDAIINLIDYCNINTEVKKLIAKIILQKKW